LAVAAWVSTHEGFRGQWISVRDPLRPALVGAGLLAIEAARGVAWGGLRVALAALGLGAAFAAFGFAADRADLGRRIDAARPAAGARPDVLLLLLDTLRADALGVHGAAPSPSPALDALAAESVVFERAIAAAPWTVPSVIALLSGRHPSSFDPDRGRPRPDLRLATGVPTLPQALRAAGYHVAGFTKNPLVGPGSGLEAGFEVYEHVGGDDAELRSGAQLVDATLRWARVFGAWRRDGGDAPFFLSVHFMDPHVDYLPPRAFRSPETRAYRGPFDGRAATLHRMTRSGPGPADGEIAQMRRLYRDEVAYLDAQVARLLAGLTALGLLDPRQSVLVVTSDHGEQFGEHGRFEHGDLHVENVHVPLWIRAPGLAPRRVPQVVAGVDLTPTLLDLLGLPPLAGQEGRSVAPLLRGDPLSERPAVTEYGGATRVTGARWSLLRNGDGSEELYDGVADPREREDRAGAATPERAVLEAALAEHAARPVPDAGPPARARPLDPALRERLEQLGYLEPPDPQPGPER
nr:sulfatase [Myxococcota bacterium]